MSIDLSKKYQKTDKSVSFDTFLLLCCSHFWNNFGPKCIKKLTNNEMHCWEYFATFDTFLIHFCLFPKHIQTSKAIKNVSNKNFHLAKMYQKSDKSLSFDSFLSHFWNQLPSLRGLFWISLNIGAKPMKPFRSKQCTEFWHKAEFVDY